MFVGVKAVQVVVWDEGRRRKEQADNAQPIEWIIMRLYKFYIRRSYRYNID